MQIGESQAVMIDSGKIWNVTNIRLNLGERYRFDASGHWYDAGIRSGPDGYTSPSIFLKAAEGLRRAPKENWFALIGAIDSNAKTAFLIDTRSFLTVSRAGTLACFANDIRFMYWNNAGSVQLNVTRLR